MSDRIFDALQEPRVIGIMRANRIATVSERALAWDTLMASTEPTDAAALMEAVEAFTRAVSARVTREAERAPTVKGVSAKDATLAQREAARDVR